jgi:RNA polymerase sigma-70 factor (ECF subfamily)
MMQDARASFERDYDEHADAIFRFLYYRLQDRERALELTQDVFMRFFEYLESGKRVEHTKTFLYRSAKNAFINEIRTKKKTVSLEERLDAGSQFSYEEVDAEHLASQKEAVARASSLEEPYRSALVMRYVEGMQIKDIAEILETRENTVSVWIKRGIEHLKKTYG